MTEKERLSEEDIEGLVNLLKLDVVLNTANNDSPCTEKTYGPDRKKRISAIERLANSDLWDLPDARNYLITPFRRAYRNNEVREVRNIAGKMLGYSNVNIALNNAMYFVKKNLSLTSLGAAGVGYGLYLLIK